MKNPRISTWLIAGATLLRLATGIANADDDAPSLKEALADGEPGVTLRYRFENVSQDGVPADARASTLRTTLSYETLEYRHVRLFVEAENVSAVGSEKLYRNAGAGDLSNGVLGRPVVADPADTGILQAFARIGDDETTVTVGRQEINLADQRFVGNVGWRQNHQSFDAVRIENRSLARTTLHYSFIDRVQRIFGDSKDLNGHLVDAAFETGSAGTLRLFGYLLDYERSPDAALSTATYGVSLTGKRELGESSALLYDLAVAEQRDAADNPSRIDAGYRRAIVGVVARGVTVRAGWEVLEGQSGEGAFSTPLATLHKFNGWADKFLVTPRDGMVDLYLHVGGTVSGIGWAAVFHDFSADTGDADYGSELDLSATYRTDWGQQIGIKAALYNSDGFATDTDKWMAWTAYTF